MVSNTTKFINFIGADRFNSIANSYLVNLYNCMKTKEKEIQVDLFIPLMSCKYEKKKRAQVFQISICLVWKISNLKNKLEDEFV